MPVKKCGTSAKTGAKKTATKCVDAKTTKAKTATKAKTTTEKAKTTTKATAKPAAKKAKK